MLAAMALSSNVWHIIVATSAERCDKAASPLRTDRPELARVIRGLEAGDVLIVTRLDRLARSTRDLLNVLDAAPRKARASDL